MCNHDCECCHSLENGHLKQIYIAVIILIIALLIPNETLKPYFFIVSYFIAGYNVLFASLKNILKGQIFDENFLMSAATIGALCIKEYPEAVMVMILYLLGEHFQDKAVDKTRDSIASLMDFRPEYANIERNGVLEKISPELIETGSIIIVKPGEKIPLDGVITEGASLIDTSSLTGESIPVIKQAGDEVLSGSVNTSGLIKIRVTKIYKESTVSKILELVENSANKKAKTEKYITKFAKIYTPIVVLLALCIIIVPVFLTGAENINDWIRRGLTFLVISCPCAFVISVPLTFFAGIGCGSKHGILFKGGNYLEMLSKVSAVAFDKTGTVTKGSFSVKDIIPAENTEKSELIKLAAYLESCSNHPVAQAISKLYKETIDNSQIKKAEEISGLGVKAEVFGTEIIIGNLEIMRNFDVKIPQETNNNGIIFVARNREYIGHFIISDELKENAIKTVTSLKRIIPKIVMLTGDSEANAKDTAEKLGITEYYSKLLPADKTEKVENMIKNGYTTAFAGDGVNDAPVLMRADIGIAMGALGSDSAIEAADVVITDDDISRIPAAIEISKYTMRIVKQNIVFAIGVKFLFLFFGAVGLMTMWGAVFADVGVTLIAVLNSLRILRK